MNSHAASLEMTPPSSVHMSQQASQSALSATNAHPLPTPTSLAGPSVTAIVDSDGDALMDETYGDGAARLGRHRLTNHNRQKESIFSPEGGVAAAKGICGSQLFKLCQSGKVPCYAGQFCAKVLICITC